MDKDMNVDPWLADGCEDGRTDEDVGRLVICWWIKM